MLNRARKLNIGDAACVGITRKPGFNINLLKDINALPDWNVHGVREEVMIAYIWNGAVLLLELLHGGKAQVFSRRIVHAKVQMILLLELVAAVAEQAFNPLGKFVVWSAPIRI